MAQAVQRNRQRRQARPLQTDNQAYQTPQQRRLREEHRFRGFVRPVYREEEEVREYLDTIMPTFRGGLQGFPRITAVREVLRYLE